jgi:hypothetical protein
MTPLSQSMSISNVPTSRQSLDRNDQRDVIEDDVLSEHLDRSRTSNKIVVFNEWKNRGRAPKVDSTEEIKGVTDTVQSNIPDKSLPDSPIARGEESRRPSIEFTKVVRAHFTNPILDALQEIQPHALSPNATLYINHRFSWSYNRHLRIRF